MEVLDGSHNGKQLLIMDFVVNLSMVQLTRKEADGTKKTIVADLRDNTSYAVS
jgi:hypothetical protein